MAHARRAAGALGQDGPATGENRRRALHTAEEQIIARPDAILTLSLSTKAQVHPRRFARDLRTDLALEDNSDAVHFANALHALPDLLFRPDGVCPP